MLFFNIYQNIEGDKNKAADFVKVGRLIYLVYRFLSILTIYTIDQRFNRSRNNIAIFANAINGFSVAHF